jgi:hypothetical protein
MAMELARTIFAVIEYGDGWAVESGGSILERKSDKDEAKAAAHRRARKSQDAGRACMVRVSGENGFVTKSDRNGARQVAAAGKPNARFLPRT